MNFPPLISLQSATGNKHHLCKCQRSVLIALGVGAAAKGKVKRRDTWPKRRETWATFPEMDRIGPQMSRSVRARQSCLLSASTVFTFADRGGPLGACPPQAPKLNTNPHNSALQSHIFAVEFCHVFKVDIRLSN